MILKSIFDLDNKQIENCNNLEYKRILYDYLDNIKD